MLLVRPEKENKKLPAVIVLHGTGGAKEGERGWLTSSTAVPTRHRSPIEQPLISTPRVVRFSPNVPGCSGPTCRSHQP